MFTNPIKFVHRGIRNWSRRQKRVVVTCQHRLKNLAVFVSGSGSNFRKIYKSCREGYINGSCVLVVTNNPDCLAAEFAQSQNIPVSIYPNEEMSSDLATKALVDTLKTEYGVDFILLAGYLRLIPSELLKAYPDSILNIHPALLPSFGGKGYYGRKVHEAVLKSGAKFSGATVHFVNEEYDKGSILDQRVIPVLPNDTAETLAARVLVQEHELYPYCVRALCNGQIKRNKNRIPFIEQLSQSTIFTMTSHRILRWGVVGTGEIAQQFAKDLIEHTPDINILTSVLSRTREKAIAFGSRFNINKKNCFSEFASFAASSIDVCYIATPHTHHVSDALRCLDRNLAVLVEKPFALKARDAAKVFQKAQEKRLFVMEAVWTRFIPAMKAVSESVQSSKIGSVVSIDFDYGFDGKFAPARLKDPALAGGALFDLGTYGLHLGTLFSKKNPHPAIPKIIHTESKVKEDGVDEKFKAILSYPSEAQGEETILNMRLAINERTSQSAFIHGKNGHILIHPPCLNPDTITINGETERIKKKGHGLHYQTREVYECIRKGKLESDVIPWNESLNWAATFEELATKRQ